jgi:hypothetical protein
MLQGIVLSNGAEIDLGVLSNSSTSSGTISATGNTTGTTTPGTTATALAGSRPAMIGTGTGTGTTEPELPELTQAQEGISGNSGYTLERIHNYRTCRDGMEEHD